MLFISYNYTPLQKRGEGRTNMIVPEKLKGKTALVHICLHEDYMWPYSPFFDYDLCMKHLNTKTKLVKFFLLTNIMHSDHSGIWIQKGRNKDKGDLLTYLPDRFVLSVQVYCRSPQYPEIGKVGFSLQDFQKDNSI